MTDVHSLAIRSKNMRAIRSANTKPELLVRKALHAAGFRYRLHGKDLPGRPDLVLPKYRTVIFIHGCFWHGHNCKYFKLPKSRTAFWEEKIKTNQDRDRRSIAKLNEMGWRVVVVWECAAKPSAPNLPAIVRQISTYLTEKSGDSPPALLDISAAEKTQSIHAHASSLLESTQSGQHSTHSNQRNLSSTIRYTMPDQDNQPTEVGHE